MNAEHKFVCHYSVIIHTFIVYFSVYKFYFEIILGLVIICPSSVEY